MGHPNRGRSSYKGRGSGRYQPYRSNGDSSQNLCLDKHCNWCGYLIEKQVLRKTVKCPNESCGRNLPLRGGDGNHNLPWGRCVDCDGFIRRDFNYCSCGTGTENASTYERKMAAKRQQQQFRTKMSLLQVDFPTVSSGQLLGGGQSGSMFGSVQIRSGGQSVNCPMVGGGQSCPIAASGQFLGGGQSGPIAASGQLLGGGQSGPIAASGQFLGGGQSGPIAASGQFLGGGQNGNGPTAGGGHSGNEPTVGGGQSGNSPVCVGNPVGVQDDQLINDFEMMEVKKT